MSIAKLEDLPEDILVLIFPLLDVPDFLSLCTVNKYFHEVFSKNPEFWREITTKSFRIPVQPLLRANGPRWYWLYKNLRMHTRVYEWGGSGRSLLHSSSNKTWPAKSQASAKIGNIVDLQCGGWSSSCLTSDGELYLAGRIDGLEYDYASPLGYRRLSFGLGFTATSADSYEKSTAIKQFSSGRRHVLALSDDGRIWSWSHRGKEAKLVEFSCAQTILNSPDPSTPGTVTKVVSGWDMNSVFITGTGIVYWRLPGRQSDDDGSGISMVPGEIVPDTGFRRPKSTRRNFEDADVGLGEVINHIVLEAYIVFITDLNRVYAMKADGRDMTELPNFSAPGRILQDIQGAFRNFAVFTATGEVMMGNNDLIRDAFTHADDPTNAPSPRLPAGLQYSDVISISFGDYHYNALHSNGKISSYGREPRGCGSLGLGSDLGGIPFRGLTMDEENRRYSDAYYFPYAEDKRHDVWFEPEKRHWLLHLSDAAVSRQGSSDWIMPFRENRQGLMEKYSTCVERAGDNWDDFPDIKAEDPDCLGAYFALSVAAAGWQTVALVLVNEELAEKVRRKHLIDPEREERFD
ncbi:hypothetical protein FQN49_005336, partial [Arthroderma sp. PD_2]